MDNQFLVFVLLGGLPVVLSYAALYFSEGASRLVVFKGASYWMWLVSALVTVGAYFTFLIQLVSSRDHVEHQYWTSFMLFLSNAASWGMTAHAAQNQPSLRWFVLINLLGTAAASSAMLWYAIDEEDVLLIVSGAWLVFHHLVVDAGAWSDLWFQQLGGRQMRYLNRGDDV